MSHETAREAIATLWKAVWDAGPLAAMQIEFQNMKINRVKNQAWGRYTLLPGQTEPAALGTRGMKFERTPFVLILQIFSPEGQGTKKPFQAADVMKGMDYQKVRKDVPGAGFVVVNFNTAGLTPGVAEDGLDAFNVTISGHWDTYQSSP